MSSLKKINTPGNQIGYHDKPVFALAPINEDLLASGSLDKTIKIWDLNKGKCVNTFSENHAVFSLLFAGENSFYSGLSNGAVNKWQVETDKVSVLSVKAHQQAVTAFCRLPGKGFSTASKDGQIPLLG